jgi:hypothetical protein
LIKDPGKNKQKLTGGVGTMARVRKGALTLTARTAREVEATLPDWNAADYRDAEPDTQMLMRAMSLSRVAAMVTGTLAAEQGDGAIPWLRVWVQGAVAFDGMTELAEEYAREGDTAAATVVATGRGDRVDLCADTEEQYLAALDRMDQMMVDGASTVLAVVSL